jgi:hypothetical protein
LDQLANFAIGLILACGADASGLCVHVKWEPIVKSIRFQWVLSAALAANLGFAACDDDSTTPTPADASVDAGKGGTGGTSTATGGAGGTAKGGAGGTSAGGAGGTSAGGAGGTSAGGAGGTSAGGTGGTVDAGAGGAGGISAGGAGGAVDAGAGGAGGAGGAVDAGAGGADGATDAPANVVNGCTDFVDESGNGTTSTAYVTWVNPLAATETCIEIKVGESVTFGPNMTDFDTLPLTPSGGDTPNPIQPQTTGDADYVVTFPTAGTFGFRSSAGVMLGAIHVVP